MYFLALATDYDGTIAGHGTVDDETLAALKRLKETGRRLILVTGRELPDLKVVFPGLPLFDRVVAENGALIYDPGTEEARPISPAPPVAFVEALRARNVTPLSVGESIVGTWEPNQDIVLETIRELGLELQIIFNKGAVMILPSGMNKAEGLKVALADLGLSPHNVVGVGDAQNDHAFLQACGCAVAVANALPMVKEGADIVLSRDHGEGVIDLIDLICEKDARLVSPERHGLAVGQDRKKREFYLLPECGSVLIAGSSGIGKSTLATALTERMLEKGLEFCVFDPEGDYTDLEHAVSIGNAKEPPVAEEALKLLQKTGTNIVVNTQALDIAERPAFFAGLLAPLAAFRAKTGRPHWLIIDEAHHLLPAERENVGQVLPDDIPSTIFVTVHPEALSPGALKTVETVLALGPTAPATIADFAEAAGIAEPVDMPTPEGSEVLAWEVAAGTAPRRVTPRRPKQARRRHSKKYAVGELGEDVSFYFRGPDGKLNLRAQNLALFNQIAAGVDDRTWEHHLRSGEYSAWFRDVIKDDELAEETARVEADPGLTPAESRKLIANAISRLYTAPARPRAS